MSRNSRLPPRRRPFIRAILAASACLAITSASGADTPAAAERSVDGPHAMQVAVKMIGPVTQATDLQVICVLKHDPRGDKYIEAMADLNAKLGGLLSSLRDRGEFVGEAGETLLFTPPAGSIAPRRVLLIGVGDEATVSLDRLRLAGTIAAREAVRLGAEHVAFAPTLRDQGSTRIDVADGDAAVADGVVLAYDTAKRLQAQGLAPKADIADFTIEAGPKFFDGAAAKVRAAVSDAEAQLGRRSDAAYVTPPAK